MNKPKLLLIDSSALIYRAFYALPPLTDKKGRVVNAVYGFASAFLTILKQTGPTHLVFAFDSPKPTRRKEKYVEYKAHREKAPDELYAQMPISKELVAGFGFQAYEQPGFEADDIIATGSRVFLKEHPEGEVIIATGDMDTLQLVNSRVRVRTLSRGISETKIYDQAAVKERYGLSPSQMNDWKALNGDPSDNIKGVSGIGPKTASGLLQKYKSLDGIYQNLAELKSRLREVLEKEKEQAYLSKELVTLHTDMPIEIDWKEAEFAPEKLGAGKQFLLNLAFDSLVKRIEKWGEGRGTRNMGLAEEGENSKSFVLPLRRGGARVNEDGSLRRTVQDGGVKTEITNISDLEKIYPPLKKAEQIILWTGATDQGKSLVVAPVQNNEISEIFLVSADLAKNLDKAIFKNKSIFLFDLKNTHKDLFPLEIPVKNIRDLKLRSYLIQPPLIRKFGFKEIIWHFLKERFEEPKKQLNLLSLPIASKEPEKDGYGQEKISELIGLLNKLVPEVEGSFAEQEKFQKNPAPYDAGRGPEPDANVGTERGFFIDSIFPTVKNKIEERSIEYVYREIERPLAQVLAQMEIAGIKINLKLLDDLRQKNAFSVDRLKEKIYHLAHREFNLDSPSQLATILFQELNISAEGSKKGKAGHFSTAAGVLQKLEKKHPIISLLLDYREQRKFQSTYLDVIPELTDKENNRLHTSFDQTGAATGRLSSNNPNLQNIPLQPIEKNIGIRHAFVAENGFSLVSLDYSQIEIRLAAYLSGEEKLIRAFEKGEDVHRQTAAFVNGISPEEVTDNMRSAAKALNFGIIYGMSPFGFAAASSLSESESRVFIQNYFREFPRIAEYMDHVKLFARQHGFVETVFGRRRYVPEVASPDRMLRQSGERMVVNMPLQGTAADIMKLALVKVQEHLNKNYSCRATACCGQAAIHPLERDARILLSIHDEIILEVRNNLVEKIAGEAREIMENVAKDIIPLKVDVEIGNNWGEI